MNAVDPREGRAILERLVRENPSLTQFQRDLAASYQNIGVTLSATGRPTLAMASYKQALAIFERLVRENASVSQFQQDLAGAHTSIGTLQRETGQPAQAVASFEQAPRDPRTACA